MIIVKISAERHKLTSHAIAMPFGGDVAMAAQARRSLPRSPGEIQELLKIIYVGTNQFNAVRSALLLGLTSAVCDAGSIYRFLQLLRDLMNPRYATLDIPRDVNALDDYSVVSMLPPQMILPPGESIAVPVEAPAINTRSIIAITDSTIVRMNAMVSNLPGNDYAGVRNGAAGEEDDGPILSTLHIHEDPLIPPAAGAQEGEIDFVVSSDQNMSLLIGARGQGPSTESTHRDNSFQLLASIRETGRPPTNVNIPVLPGDEIPYNTYVQQPTMLPDCFPTLFLLGQGVPPQGTLDKKWVHHLNRQYTLKFEMDKQFQFTVFGHQQLAASARLVALKVKNNPGGAERAGAMLQSPEFVERLQRALADPIGEDSIEVQRLVAPLLSGIAARIPHSASERANVISNLFAMAERFGPACAFFTIAPDDTNTLITIRLCYGVQSNERFPAVGSIPFIAGEQTLEWVLNNNYDMQNALDLQIPLSQQQKVLLAAMNPVQTSKLYNFMNEVLCEQLMGIKLHSPDVKKSLPRVDESLLSPGSRNSCSLPLPCLTLRVYIDLPPDFKRRLHEMFGGDLRDTTPVLLRALAFLLVTEETKRKALHTHLVAMLQHLKPDFLQCMAGHPYFEKLICKIIDSIFATELPVEILLKDALLKDVGGLPSPRMTRTLPPDITMKDGLPCTEKEGLDELEKFANRTSGTVNVHRHYSPGTCDPKQLNHDGTKSCRLAKSSPMETSTRVIQLAPDPDDPQGFLVVPVTPQDPTTLSRNRVMGSGLNPMDSRPIMYVNMRRELDVNNLLDSPWFNFHQELLTPEGIEQWREEIIMTLNSGESQTEVLTPTELELIRGVTLAQALRLKEVLLRRNGLVVDFSKITTAVLRCNTAMYHIGSSSQSIAIFMYLVKYLSKDADNLCDSLAVIAKCKEYMDLHRSNPRENETEDMRYLKQFSQRILNLTDQGTREMSDVTVAYANSGGAGHRSSDAFSYCFGYDSVRTVRKVYENLDVNEESEEVSYGTIPMYYDSNQRLVAMSQATLYMDRIAPQYAEVRIRILAEQMGLLEDKRLEIDQDGGNLDDLLPFELNVALAQCLFNNTLEHFNMREFAAGVQLELMTPEIKARAIAARDNPDWRHDRDRPPGREPAMRFLLNPINPLAETHCLCLKSKLSVVVFAGGKPPKCPTTVIAPGVNVPLPLQNHRNVYSYFIIANFVPYSRNQPPCVPDGNGGMRDLSLDWDGFCALCDYLYSPEASFIDRGRLSEIRNLGFATREHPDFGKVNKILVTKYRYQNADDLNNPLTINPFGINRRSAQSNIDPENDVERDPAARRLLNELLQRNEVRS